jgi:hypothetical protein
MSQNNIDLVQARITNARLALRLARPMIRHAQQLPARALSPSLRRFDLLESLLSLTPVAARTDPVEVVDGFAHCVVAGAESEIDCCWRNVRILI